MKVAADTITEEQIKTLRSSGAIGPSTMHFALSACDDHTRRYYRERCADAWNASAPALDEERP